MKVKEFLEDIEKLKADGEITDDTDVLLEKGIYARPVDGVDITVGATGQVDEGVKKLFITCEADFSVMPGLCPICFSP